MKAKLTKIEHTKTSRNGDVAFQRLHLTLEDGGFAMTDVVSSFRNYRYWKPVIESGVGTHITGVKLKGLSKIDADSQVSIIQTPLKFEGAKLDL